MNQDNLDIYVRIKSIKDALRLKNHMNQEKDEVSTRKDELISLYEEYYNLIVKQQEELLTVKISNINTKMQYLNCKNEQKRLEKEEAYYKKQSEQDELTGLANRYSLKEYSDKYFKMAYEKQRYFGVIIIDVDHFKEINDCYGHVCGDQRLMLIADIIRSCSKKQFCARFGGDEFFVITYDMGEEEVYEIAQSIKDETQKITQSKREEEENLYFTVSQGYYVGVPKNKQTFVDFWQTADVALFEGKRKGKNCISKGKLP